MVNSMTAFSKNEADLTEGRIYWEIRSLNQRYLDIHIDLPKRFNHISWIIRDKIKKSIIRGKIECVLYFDINQNECNKFVLNEHLIHFLINSAKWIKKQINEGEIDILNILYYPGVISHPRYSSDHIYKALLLSFQETLQQLIQNRKKEGSFLKQYVIERLKSIRKLIIDIQQHIPGVLLQRRNRLMDIMKSVCSNIDTVKLEQELLITSQKIDISEEITRLSIHEQEMHYILSLNGAVGRKLDFLTQELQREANTLTSKSINAHIVHLALSLKVLIEQIREQVQNIE